MKITAFATEAWTSTVLTSLVALQLGEHTRQSQINNMMTRQLSFSNQRGNGGQSPKHKRKSGAPSPTDQKNSTPVAGGGAAAVHKLRAQEQASKASGSLHRSAR